MFSQPHFLGIAGLHPAHITALLDRAESAFETYRRKEKPPVSSRRLTQINLFFEPSTRTQASFEIAGRALGLEVVNLAVATSSTGKGETLTDTALTLNAMRPDVIVIRHPCAGALHLLVDKVDCALVNAGDGAHEHPTQALLDALTIRRHKGEIGGLVVAICGDIFHSRVARSNILLLTALGARVRVIAPPPLMPPAIEKMGVEPFTSLHAGLEGVDAVMMLRLQHERMNGSFLASQQEYAAFYRLDGKALAQAKPDALVMHPGPMNRGVEIASDVADGVQSVIQEQVETGVAVRMAVLEAVLSHRLQKEIAA